MLISPQLLGPAALELATKTKSTVRVAQAVISPATRMLAAETSSSWLDLLNFMRIFRHGAGKAGPYKTRFGIETQSAQGKAAPGIRLRSLRLPPEPCRGSQANRLAPRPTCSPTPAAILKR